MVREASNQDQFENHSALKERNEILRKFYAEVKIEKGKPLTLRALTGIRAAKHRQITSPLLSRNVNIRQDNDFMSAWVMGS